MPIIVSTMTDSVKYQEFKKGADGQLAVDGDGILIPGRHAGKREVGITSVIIPNGVATEVSNAQLEQLKNNAVFQIHEKNGFIAVEKKTLSAFNKSRLEEKPPNDSKKDAAAQITPEDMKKAAKTKGAAQTKKG